MIALTTKIGDTLQRGRCQARVRLFGFLWPVQCGGALAARHSVIHPRRNYSICERCGDVTWPPRTNGERKCK